MFVAAYCRVSTDREDQANSFESQCRYFSEHIRKTAGWKLYRVYADEGLSGTAVENRDAFQQMLRDARDGRFQILLTKEVSRFSRNLLDAVLYTRELKTLGVSVHFVSDGIRSSDPDAELRLSIMASLAQEESRKTSARVKWGQLRQMERGVVFGHSLLGYDLSGGRLQVNSEGAKLVQKIFELYALSDCSAAEISRLLEREEQYYSPATILKILKNEKYMGDLVQKKSITPDYLSHKKRPNHGEEELVILRDHHEPIVSRELWELAAAKREERARRKANGTKSPGYEPTLCCGLCSSPLRSRVRIRNQEAVRYWYCPRKRCSLKNSLRSDTLEEMLRQSLSSLTQRQLDTPCSPALMERLTLFPKHAVIALKGLPCRWIFER